jgi:protein-tyrosine phosphatase
MERILRESAAFESVRVGSAGLRPVPRGRICELVGQHESADPGWAEFSAEHVSLHTRAPRVEQARIVLTASRANRAAVATLSPEARSKIFTLREALWLGADFRREPSLSGEEAVTAFARHLDARRGAGIPPAERRLPFRPRRDPLSIPDGHTLSRREHAATIRQVHEVAESLARLLVSDAPAPSIQRRAYSS